MPKGGDSTLAQPASSRDGNEDLAVIGNEERSGIGRDGANYAGETGLGDLGHAGRKGLQVLLRRRKPHEKGTDETQ